MYSIEQVYGDNHLVEGKLVFPSGEKGFSHSAIAQLFNFLKSVNAEVYEVGPNKFVGNETTKQRKALDRSEFLSYHKNPALWNQECLFDGVSLTPKVNYVDEAVGSHAIHEVHEFDPEHDSQFVELPDTKIKWAYDLPDAAVFDGFLLRSDRYENTLRLANAVPQESVQGTYRKVSDLTQALSVFMRKSGREVHGEVSINEIAETPCGFKLEMRVKKEF